MSEATRLLENFFHDNTGVPNIGKKTFVLIRTSVILGIILVMIKFGSKNAGHNRARGNCFAQ